MSKKPCRPLVKRLATALTLGLIFGFICASFASYEAGRHFWGSALMWSIVFNRMAIGFTIAFAGFVRFHPLLHIRMQPLLRGGLIGFFISLTLALSAYIIREHDALEAFWGVALMGTAIGMIIDSIATYIAGEGKTLLEGTEKK